MSADPVVDPSTSTAGASKSNVIKSTTSRSTVSTLLSSATQLQWKINEKCLCYHGPLIYEAKILKIRVFTPEDTENGEIGPNFLVHYKGWKQTWDEWVTEQRILKLDEAGIAKQRTLAQSAVAAQSASGNVAAGKMKDSSGKTTTTNPAGPSASAGGSTRSGVRKEGARGTKRGREDDDGHNARRAEMKLNVPELLKVLLVDDWEAVTKNHQLVTLPRSPTVHQILSQFEEHVKSTMTSLPDPQLLTHTICAGLQIYFDRSCGMSLLYRFERHQYAEVRKKYITGPQVKIEESSDVEMSSIYGGEHLLRMLVSLPQMVANSQMDGESISLVREYVNELLRYLESNKESIFQREYDTPSESYGNTVRS
ncbi:MRG-domain-containing protein [Lentinula aciculospora]|uniref:Chromatin modification-related protein EAF3 n=1 Tax=Lentinula aciculospora TaxID=153920 RepID=A0A9W9A4Z0_9AGAR|nr:MRG-domain-containing protein [Lentinula aciculospora]